MFANETASTPAHYCFIFQLLLNLRGKFLTDFNDAVSPAPPPRHRALPLVCYRHALSIAAATHADVFKHFHCSPYLPCPSTPPQSICPLLIKTGPLHRPPYPAVWRYFPCRVLGLFMIYKCEWATPTAWVWSTCPSFNAVLRPHRTATPPSPCATRSELKEYLFQYTRPQSALMK